jgi:hypothetical protein
MKYNKIVFGLLLVATSFTACNKELDALLTNPNYPSSTTADVDLYLNKVQLDFNNFFQSVSGSTACTSSSELLGWAFLSKCLFTG